MQKGIKKCFQLYNRLCMYLCQTAFTTEQYFNLQDKDVIG